MADVFLSYARGSAGVAMRVAAALRDQGYSVWFDEELPAHCAYADVIAAELDAARAVLVLWSEAAARSQWVRSEADRARERGNLVQLRLDGTRLPMPFDQIQCAQMERLDEQIGGTAWKSVTSAISALVNGERGQAEPQASPVGDANPEPSIAVLPFRELGAATGDYLGEGLAEEIVTALSRLPGLRVAAGGRDEAELGGRELARALNADCYLEGSVRRAGMLARISLRLTDTQTGYARWSESFERDLPMSSPLRTRLPARSRPSSG